MEVTTIEDIIKAKYELENKITEAFREFNNKYSVHITGVEKVKIKSGCFPPSYEITIVI